MHKRGRKWRNGILLGALLAGICVFSKKEIGIYEEQEIYFSLEESFYDCDAYLELSTLLPGDIYYTTDGSKPSREARLYREPILLSAGEHTNAVTVRAIAYYGEESFTDIYTRTYFSGKDVRERFSTLIVCISSDWENLYDYEKGILVPGKLRDEYLSANPEGEITIRTPANYNLRGMESEREAYVEMWEPDGTCVVSQNMGIRVSGGSSRGKNMKSLRLIARDSYGESRLSCELFPGAIRDVDGELNTEYKRVVLRNHGNDEGYGYIRNELAQRLAADAGLLDTQAFRPAAVFLNGEYYGFEWLEENYDDVYFHTHYGTRGEEGSWQVLTPHRGNAATASEEEADIRAVLELNQVFSYKDRALREDAVFEELLSQLDMENFLLYCAIELYISNPDWPNNNCKAYRWYSRTETYTNPYADGKWRFLLYDLDVGMGRTESSQAENPTLGEAFGYAESSWDRAAPLLWAVLQREDMRKRFTEIMEELMEGAFSPEHALRALEEMEGEMEAELRFHMENQSRQEEAFADSTWEEHYRHTSVRHREELEKIRVFFYQRPEIMRQELEMLNCVAKEKNIDEIW